jgi:Tol biopolymer transport system component
MPDGNARGGRIVRAIAGYGIVAFALLQIIEPIMHGLHLPDATLTFLLIGLALVFPLVVAVSWALDRLQLAGVPASPTGSSAPGWSTRIAASPVSLAGMGVLVAVVSVAATLFASRHPQARHPTLTQLTLSGTAESPAWSPDRKSIVFVSRSGPVRRLTRRDLAAGVETALTHSGADELHPAWSPDGARILFVRARKPGQLLQPGDDFGVYSEGDVWQLELPSGKETLLVNDAFHPSWAPGGKQIAVDSSWAGPRRIWIVDEMGHNPLQVSTDTSEEVTHLAPRFSPDGKRIVFQSIERTKYDVRVVDLETRQQRWITNDYANDLAPDWSASGDAIYFSSDRSGSMNLWRAPWGAELPPLQQITTGAGKDVELALSRDGKRLAFATRQQNADLWRLPVSPATGLPTGEPEAVISTTREDSRGAFSPDGALIAFNSDRAGEMNIWVFSLKDGSTRQLTRGQGGDFQPNWSPDGKTIVFFSSRSGAPNIWTVDVASGALTALTGERAFLSVSPFFSPDGRSIAFQSDRSGRNEIWVMGASGQSPRRLTDNGAGGHFLRWADAGDAVVYRCTCGGHPATLRVPLAGGAPVPLVEQKGGAHISFSPDRKRIMDVVGHKVLWVTPLDGTGPQKVFEFPDATARIDYPVWSPDGKWVLFDRTHPQGSDIWQLADFE